MRYNMRPIENDDLLIQASIEMENLSKVHCINTPCTEERMQDVENDDNCEWYHGAWMYCRMAKIVVSEDYLGEQYESFFSQHTNDKRIDILVCGMADYATLAHVLRRVPSYLEDKIYITLLDICNSPLLLCKWYTEKMYPQYSERLSLIKADATQIPLPDASFDLITSYSFLTRMVYSEAQKVSSEWIRLLKNRGEILTSVHVFNNSDCEGKFYRSQNADIDYALAKLEQYISEHTVSDCTAEIMRIKVKKYLSNIMSVAMSESNLQALFSRIEYAQESHNQPGELEQIHKMLLIRAVKSS